VLCCEPSLSIKRDGVNRNTSLVLSELIVGWELFSLLIAKVITVELGRFLFRQLMEGIRFLHENKIAHLDIKPENIMVSETGELRIIDFDLCSEVNSSFPKGLALGTKNYRAPEIMDQTCSDLMAADIFSAGVVLFSMLHTRLPFCELEPNSQEPHLREMLWEQPHKFWNQHDPSPESFRSLFAQMVSRNPSERPTAAEVLKHEWLQGPEIARHHIEALLSKFPLSKLQKQLSTRANQERYDRLAHEKNCLPVHLVSFSEHKEAVKKTWVFTICRAGTSSDSWDRESVTSLLQEEFPQMAELGKPQFLGHVTSPQMTRLHFLVTNSTDFDPEPLFDYVVFGADHQLTHELINSYMLDTHRELLAIL
jgi:serine/threonine protein kinase